MADIFTFDDGTPTEPTYIGIDEESTYYDVTCDGYIFRLYNEPAANYLSEIRNTANDTLLWNWAPTLNDGSYNYYLHYDTVMTGEIIENTPTRIVIRIIATFDRNPGAGEDYMQDGDTTDVEPCILTFIIYPDRIFFDFDWTTDGTVTIADNSGNAIIGDINQDVALTNSLNFCEDTGVEIYDGVDSEDLTRIDKTTAQYLGGTSDELSLQVIMLENEGDNSSYRQLFWDDVIEFVVGYNNVILQAERHHLVFAVIIDSAEREWGSKKYTSVERLEMGDQYKDQTIVDPAISTIYYEEGITTLTATITGITVPDDADAAILIYNGYGDINPQITVSNFDADANNHFTLIEEALDGNAHNSCAGLILKYGETGFPTRGATGQVLSVTIDHTPQFGDGRLTLFFLSGFSTGSDCIIGSDKREGVHGDWISADLGDVRPADLMIVAGTGFDNAVESTPTGSGQTEILEGSDGNRIYWAIAYAYGNSTGALGYSSGNYDAFIAFAIRRIPRYDKGVGAYDINIPANIMDFTADGAWHIEPNSSDETKLTWDRTRHNPNIVIHDPGFLTGTVGSETDHLIGHWKCDDNAASTVIIDETGLYDGTLEGGDNTEDISQTDAARGRSLLTNGTDDVLDLSVGLAGLTDQKALSLLIKFKPNFNYNTGTYQPLLGFATGSADRITFYYDYLNDQFRFYDDLDNYATGYVVKSYTATNGNECPQWHTLLISLDLASSRAWTTFDGETLEHVLSETDWLSTLDIFEVGDNYANIYGEYYIDEVKLFDGCLLPFGGGPFTGNGEVDADVAHSDITAYIKGDEATSDPLQIGTGILTITNASHTTGIDGINNSAFDFDGTSMIVSFQPENINSSKSKISWWYKMTGTPATYARFFNNYDNDTLFRIYRDNSDISIRLQINTVSAQFATASIYDGNWHYIEIYWDENTNIKGCIVDGIVSTENTAAFTAPDMSGDIIQIGYSDLGGVIDQVSITNNPNTPDCWSVFGKPIHYPLLEIT